VSKGRSGLFTAYAMNSQVVCEPVKRWLSPHSFRVATITDLLTQGMSLSVYILSATRRLFIRETIHEKRVVTRDSNSSDHPDHCPLENFM